MFTDIAALIAEHRIREAMERGEFDNLSLKGQPIRSEDFSAVPAELRMGYKILKNAGCLPRELELRREMLTLRDLLHACQDDEERQILKKRLSLTSLHYNVLVEKNRQNQAFGRYADRIEGKLGL
ncbi:MAG TPA: DnaJ family domain-containing protein [Geothermobacteraceae bacterium]|nr:DnaJ family domain-containing protein [Geothermobacteraceae bacterium]